MQSIVMETKAYHVRRRHIMNQQIRICDETLQQLLSPWRLQIERHSQFVGVEVQEGSALFWMRGIPRIGTTSASVVTLRRLDLYDFSAEVRHEFCGIRRANRDSTLDDANTVQRAWGLDVRC